MPQITLVHCQPVQIFASDVPSVVDWEVAVGDTGGSGRVDLQGSPQPDPPIALPTGQASSGTVPGTTSLTLHYVKPPGGPDTVTVNFTYTVR